MTTSPWYVWLNDTLQGEWVKCSEPHESFDDAVFTKYGLMHVSPHYDYAVMREVIH